MNWTPKGPDPTYPESERYDHLLASISDPYNDKQPWVQTAQTTFFRRDPKRCTPREIELMGNCYPYWALLIFQEAETKTQIQSFISEHSKHLTPRELKAYRSASSEPFQLAQAGTYDGGFIPLTNMHDQTQVEVREQNPHQALPPGTILLCHLRHLSTHSEFNCAVPVPASQKDHLLAGMASYLVLLQDEKPKAKMAHVFSEMFPEVLQLALSCIRQA